MRCVHMKCFAFLIIFYTLLVMMPSPILCASSICIVENGRPKGIIIIAKDASQQIRHAAEELRDFIKESTNDELGSGQAECRYISMLTLTRGCFGTLNTCFWHQKRAV